MALAKPNLFNLDFGSFFDFPQVRQGRATASSALPLQNEDRSQSSSNFGTSVSVSKNGGEESNVIAKLIDAVMKEVVSGAQPRSAET